MRLRLTPAIVGLHYEALIHTPPFDKWNLPPAEDITFKVFRKPLHYGYYTRDKRSFTGLVIGIGPKVGHLSTLHGTLGHEIIHLHLDRLGWGGGVEHNSAFRKLAAQVAKIQGFDPMCY
jgi:hypothetical protein